jgi:hypothetical protein
VNQNVDLVVPSRKSTQVGTAFVRETLRLTLDSIDRPRHTRALRAAVCTLPIPANSSIAEFVRDLFLRVQDHLLAQQTENDTTLVCLTLGAVALATKEQVY